MAAETPNLLKLYYPFKLPTTWAVGVHRSPPLALYGLNFRIRASLTEQENGSKKWLAVFLECVREGAAGAEPRSNFWNCTLKEANYRVIGKATTDTVERRITVFRDFTNVTSAWGLPNMVDWYDLIGTKFLQEEHVNIEITFRVDPPVGLDFTEKKLQSAGKSHLSNDFLALYESGAGTDVVLKSRDGHEFPCHQVILSARSPVFMAMFQHDWKEKEEGVATVDMEGRSLNLFCNYLYSGNIPTVEKDMEKENDLEVWKELIKAAEMYELSHLSKLAAHAMVLRRTPNNAWEIMTFMKQFGEDKLADPLMSMKQYVAHNVKDIVGL